MREVLLHSAGADLRSLSVSHEEVGEQSILPLGGVRLALIAKDTVDMVVALVCLVLLVPLLALVALAISIDSPGPVIFRQTRVGRYGRPFVILKFRTMTDGAPPHCVATPDEPCKVKGDPRVTRLGQLLRRTSLDELPQLVNVLRGEMSLVGPRPLVPAEDELIDEPHRARLALPPGMTGPWQVLGPVRPPLRQMAVIDCLYAENWSFWNDLRILALTIGHVVRLRGI